MADGDRETHDRIRGKGTFDQAKEGLAALFDKTRGQARREHQIMAFAGKFAYENVEVLKRNIEKNRAGEKA